MANRKKVILTAAAVTLAAAAAVCLWIGLRYLADNKKPNFTREYSLYVYPGMDSREVIDSIASGAGAIRYGSLVRCAASEDLAGRMKPGKYVISPDDPAIYAIRMVCNGWQSPHKLTLSGTLRTKARIAQRISLQMMTDSASIHNLLDDSLFLAGLGFTTENVFAMILPDTYELYWTDSAQSILERFAAEYRKFWNEDRLGKADNLGLTPMEVSILASIVNGETLKAFEYPKIACVYLNRLRIGMRLQADPTVAYCFDYTLDRILRKHTQVDSPYNTYKYPGLPPAPINVPPKPCIDAVLSPDNHNYLYFCANSTFDGTHKFASTYSEHLKNAREFQRALTIRQRERAAQDQG